MNTGDTAWLLVSAALVMFMTPGLALFYGGMVRRKNILGTIVQSLVMIALISVEWALVGYSMAFGPDFGGSSAISRGSGSPESGSRRSRSTRHGSPPGVHGLPDDVRGHHPGTDHRGVCRAFPFPGLPRFQPAVGLAGVQPRAHWVWGIGGWIRTSVRSISPGNGRPHHRRGLGARGGLDRGETEGVRVGQHGAAQPADDGDRRRHPLVRVVRVQRRKRPRGGRALHARLRGDPSGGGDRVPCHGCSRSGFTGASPPCSAPPRGAWPGWRRSRQPPGSSRRFRRS